MLSGKISYEGRVYNVIGTDSASSLRLRMSSNKYDDILFMASGKEDGDELWERTVEIKVSTVTVETHVSLDPKGKKIKSPINTEMFCRIGAFIRYIKSHCYVKYIDGYIGLQLASGDYTPESETSYKVPLGTSGEFANIRLKFGEIVELSATYDGISVELLSNREEEILPAPKDGVTKGIAFNKEYLHFDLEEQSVELSNTVIGGMYRNLEEVMRAHPEKEFEWLLGKNYQIVTDETLEEVCDYIYNYDGYVYYDTETTGLNITFKSRIGQGDQCVGIILSVVDGESFFFPMQMKSIKNLCGGDHFYFMEKYIRRILEDKKIVVHNLSFDWKVSYIYDINANIVDDTLTMIALTLGQEKKSLTLKLKELTAMFLHRDSLELDDLVIDSEWGENDIRFWDLPEELVRLYACADTDNTRGLHRYVKQSDLLTKYNAHKVYEIEIAFGFAVAYQEFYGHREDVDNLKELRKEIEGGIEKYYNLMKDLIGHDFNPNSPKQLVSILYKELGIPEQRSRKTGNLTTDKETLKKLGELTDIEGNTMYPFCAYLLKYREYEGVRKIIDKFPELATPDGYLFSSVMQFGTTTGRVSINNPNYQSYNDPVKKNIVPRPGFYMFDTDYSSVEYRVLGNMSGNKMIKERFYDPDFDYHTYQASRMYQVPYASVTPKLRKAAKGINFGLPYGMGDESLGIRIFGEASAINTKKAESLRRSYFKGQEDIQVFFDSARNKGVKDNFTETYFGRRRYYDRSKFSVSSIRRQAGNQVIQGCMSGETRIQTCEFGIVKLKDIVGLNVLVWDGEQWSNGDVLYSGKKRKCVVKFKGGQEIICSPQHKFLVVDTHGREHWVEAQDLKFGYKSSANNAHVKVNTTYEPSDYEYTSKDAYQYRTNNHESNNALLENIENSFDRGVVLGRLASDGSYCVRNDGGSYITQFVAEHEYNILPELRTCMESLGYTENDPEVRKDRNEKVKRLSVYSSSLANEITDLDIKHQVHDNIFMDTEMLRGFLSGFFDGDGGISGKTISLVFGVQYNFEPMCLDLQKALLFFGIRSRYRKYDDRYVIQIKTNDNPQFLDLIGFLNQEKQDKGRTLTCKEQETTFGKCLVVDSVEVTDELIDMYDVCNTDGGYYVADGIITHNTAADIYKLAVGRVFKRICKEGWLGKVLFSGFIHDELLGEVSLDIDPMKFLKVLREEFEVKIKDSDGTPWCPLYMGFGWGTSWYQAKKTEVPIKLQWEFVDKYGETGYPLWDGDCKKFCDSIPDLISEFEVRDCGVQLLDPNNQGKEIKPALNSAIIDIVKGDTKAYMGVLDKGTMTDEDIDFLKNKMYFSCDFVDEDYKPTLEIKDCLKKAVESKKYNLDTQDAIDAFCMFHNIDRSKVNILSIPDVDVSSSTNGGTLDSSYFDDDEEDTASMLEVAINNRINTLGMYLDVDNKTLKALLVPDNYMQFIKSHTTKEGSGGYRLYFRDMANQTDYITPCEIMPKDVNIIQTMYIQYFKSLKEVK